MSPSRDPVANQPPAAAAMASLFSLLSQSQPAFLASPPALAPRVDLDLVMPSGRPARCAGEVDLLTEMPPKAAFDAFALRASSFGGFFGLPISTEQTHYTSSGRVCV